MCKKLTYLVFVLLFSVPAANVSADLLSDPDHAFIDQCNAWVLKKMYGREYYGVERSTFIIDPEGVIRRIWRKVKVKEHVEEVFQELKELQK